MAATFIGIDLAWQSDQHPSGGAVLRGDRAGAQLQVLWTIYSVEAVSEFVRSYATSDTVVAIDAPLIIVNEAGQRACETAIGKRYGSRDASCHTSNLTLYRDAPSIVLTKKLLRRGFTHVDRDNESSGRVLAEVYTHAAMVALFDLKKTIKYKKGPIAVRKAGLNKLRNYLRQLRDAEPPLLSTGLLREFLSKDLKELKGTALKNY
jgi:predicted RNase H-like nuclease